MKKTVFTGFLGKKVIVKPWRHTNVRYVGTLAKEDFGFILLTAAKIVENGNAKDVESVIISKKSIEEVRPTEEA